MKLDDFAMLEPQERQAYFSVAAERLRFSSTAVVEKDFWVCWLLQKLFSLDDEIGPLTFKGGTSLSKCYGLISRFSEDIDIGVERKTIGYADDAYFYEAPSNTKRAQRVQEHNAKAYEWLHQHITPRLHDLMSKSLLSGDWSLFPDEQMPERLYFRYPSQNGQDVSRYLRSEILIEFGTLDAWPTEKVEITPYVGNLNEGQGFETSSVRVLDPSRTFWEKAVILHKFAYLTDGKQFPTGKSRHYYDIVMLMRSSMRQKALDAIQLLPIIARYKSVFYSTSYARYDLAANPTTLLLCPPKHLRKAIERDYEEMLASMIFPESTPPTFQEMEKEISDLQEYIHSI